MVLTDLFAYSIEDAEHQTATRQVGDPHLQLHQAELNSSRTPLSSMGGIETMRRLIQRRKLRRPSLARQTM